MSVIKASHTDELTGVANRPLRHGAARGAPGKSRRQRTNPSAALRSSTSTISNTSMIAWSPCGRYGAQGFCEPHPLQRPPHGFLWPGRQRRVCAGDAADVFRRSGDHYQPDAGWRQKQQASIGARRFFPTRFLPAWPSPERATAYPTSTDALTSHFTAPSSPAAIACKSRLPPRFGGRRQALADLRIIRREADRTWPRAPCERLFR